ncbi:MAG TPA: TIGR02757 family protein [Verrucomicrobiae bacterium]|nr:TIGR02757 family protein [Verrucomicrobiae bacterium]
MRSDELKPLLESLYASRSSRHLANDPLSFCHRFTEGADREVAGLIASSFAYGKVSIILRNLEQVFSLIGPSPRSFVEDFRPRQGLRLFSGFRHRFNDHRDLCALLLAARLMIAESGSIGGFFRQGYDPAAEDVGCALSSFSARVLALDYSPVFGRGALSPGFRYLFPSPAGGSACKRLCMYLRWMVRGEDGIDLGVWGGIDAAKLVIPVDVHIDRLARCLGLTTRGQADWRTAREITAALRRLDPRDPVKYDFSLCHLGISEGCDGTDSDGCGACLIAGACTRLSG